MNTIPKSLHTVTVLVNVARAQPILSMAYSNGQSLKDATRIAVEHAAALLGYGDLTADMYGLVQKAADILTKELSK